MGKKPINPGVIKIVVNLMDIQAQQRLYIHQIDLFPYADKRE
jgi:hypothetical protein